MNQDIKKQMEDHLASLTKPLGSLGDLEDMALKLSCIQEKVPPRVRKKATYVFAADHGITEEGVSMFPKDVTRQMVLNFIGGGAAINALADHCGYDVKVVDAGVDCKPFEDPRIISKKAGMGTANFARQEAMTAEQVDACLENGKLLAQSAIEVGYNIVALGDMGIGNTSSAAAICLAAGLTDNIIDRGTGIDDEKLENKRKIIEKAVASHAPYNGAKDILRKVGGFELATMAGFILGLKGSGIACVIDGFPVTSGAYMAYLLDNTVAEYLFAGHKSKVSGHIAILNAMGLSPIVDFNMRLGEGTGAVIGGFIVDLASKFSCNMATFAEAAVSTSTGDEDNY